MVLTVAGVQIQCLDQLAPDFPCLKNNISCICETGGPMQSLDVCVRQRCNIREALCTSFRSMCILSWRPGVDLNGSIEEDC